MELQSQVPAEGELLGTSAVRTLEFGVGRLDIGNQNLDIGVEILEIRFGTL